MYKLFLLCHIIGFTMWLGGGAYEVLFIARTLKKAKGTPREGEMLKLVATAAPFFGLGVLLLLIGGIGMTAVGNLGWYRLNWLGIKQMIMTAIFIVGIVFGGPLRRLPQHVRSLGDQSTILPDDVRADVYRALKLQDIVHVGVIINLLLGVLRPF